MSGAHAIGGADHYLGVPGSATCRDLSDRQLLDRFVADHDERDFVALVQRHARGVWGVCRRVLFQEQDAEDAFQAVFTVLARKASSIRKGEAVGSWLYGVAYRTALKARQLASKRSAAEKVAPSGRRDACRRDECPASEAAARELQRQLDDELQRLPEKYKAPFVLCCLEGMSRADAARELGWKEGTVSSRLAQARKLLQTRLARRGFLLSAVLTAAALSQGTAAAAPAALVAATGSTLQGHVVSCSASALADHVLGAMGLAKVKATLGTIAALTAFFATALFAAALVFPPGDEPQAAAKAVAVVDSFVPPPTPLRKVIDERVLGLAFSPDGTKLVTAGARHENPGQLKIWDATSGWELACVRGFAGARSVAFSPTGAVIATGHFGGGLTLRDAATGAEQRSARPHGMAVNGLAFSKDGSLLATAGLDRTVKVLDVKGLATRHTLRGHSDMIFSVAYFGHGNAVVSGGKDKKAIIWDLASEKATFVLEGHSNAIEAVAVSPDDQLVATGSWDRTIKLWNAASGAEIGAITDSKSSIFAIAFSPDGASLASGAGDGTVSLWDVKTQTLLRTLGKHAGSVWSVMFSPDGARLASGSEDRTAKLWDVRQSTEIHLLHASERRPVQALAYAPDGKAIAAASDKVVRLLQPGSGDLIMTLQGHTDLVNALAFAGDGILVTGSDDRSVNVWDRNTGQVQRSLRGHTGPIHAVAVSSDGKRLASAGDDNTLKVWDRATGKEVQSLKGHLATVRGLAFSPAGDMLASGDDVGTIRLSSLDGQTQAVSLKVPGSIRALVFRGSKLACATNEGTLRVWTAAPGNLWTLKDKEPQAFVNPIGALASLAFSVNGVTLVAGGHNGSIALWDVANGQPRRILKGHKRAVTALAIHPLGENLVSGGAEGELLRWRGAAEEVGRNEVGGIEAASGKAPAVAPPVVVRNENAEPGTERDAAPVSPGRRAWLVAALVVLLGMVAALLALWRFRSNRQISGQVGADALIVFRCSACQRQLKVKPALAGKKVRCPCGAAVPAPPSTT